MIDWDSLSESDMRIIHAIARRAAHDLDVDMSLIEMDITAVHLLNPLRLRDFLVADDGDFSHDIFGIMENVDRATGELQNCFDPRFSVPADEIKKDPE